MNETCQKSKVGNVFYNDVLGNAIMLNSILNEELRNVQGMKTPKMNSYQIQLTKLALNFASLSLSNIPDIDAIV